MGAKKDNETELIRITIVEDNKYMREGWSIILDFEPDFFVLGSFDTCEKAFESDSLGRSDVVLMDIELPGMSGIEGVKYLNKNYPDINVIMATVFDDDEHIFEALKNGAIGYLMKKVGPEELCNAIRDAHHGGSPMTPQIARKVIRSMHARTNPDEQLSEKETEVLKQLSSGKSYQAIGEEIHLSVDGIRYHIRNIYNKLQVNNRSEAVAKGLKNRLI